VWFESTFTNIGDEFLTPKQGKSSQNPLFSRYNFIKELLRSADFQVQPNSITYLFPQS
jgi:hypothetical protein